MVLELFDIVDGWADSRHRDKTAVWFDGGTRTYAELRDRSRRLAHGLAELGVQQGTRVALMLGNRIEHVEAYFAVATLGAIAVPINVLLRGEEALDICRDSEVSHLIVDAFADKALDALTDAVPHLIAVGPVAAGEGAIDFEDLISTEEFIPSVVADADRVLVHYYTSGTTGKPKAAVHTHRTILASALHQVGDLHIDDSDVFLVVSSFTWAAGFNSVTMSTLLAGGTIALIPTGGITTTALVRYVSAAGATATVVAPTLLRDLARDDDALARLGETSLRRIYTGGEPLSADVIKDLGERLPTVGFCQAYGLSEFPIVACALHPEEALRKAGTVGRATTGNRLAVRDANGVISGQGEGELLIRSNATMVGYLNRPEETARAFADGWLNTGDIVHIDHDDFVTVVGRSKDMIISGGLNIYPAEIEAVIGRFPGIHEVAVVGRPDDRWGESVVAVVVAADDLDVDELDAYCRQRLATYKTPKSFVVQDTPLPRNPSGKLIKAPIRSSLAASTTPTVGAGHA